MKPEGSMDKAMILVGKKRMLMVSPMSMVIMTTHSSTGRQENHR